MVIMTTISARRDKWSLVTDVLYFDIEDDEQGSKTVPVGPFSFAVGTDADVEIKAWVVTPYIGYNVLETGWLTVDVLAGARYLSLEVPVEVKIVDRFGARKVKENLKGHGWDGIVGVRGQVKLTDKFYMPYYLDVGTGKRHSTWQALGGVGYRFGKFDAVVGFRYLEWNWSDDDDVLGNLDVTGPYGALKFKF
jgi:hypothetical protein